MAEVPILFPVHGVSDDLAYERQPAGTTRDALNVRAVDPVTGRTRGAQRAGTSKEVPATVNGASPIKDLGLVVYEEPRFDYAALNPPEPEWSENTPALVDSVDIATDLQGNVFALDGPNAFVMMNTAGTIVRREVLAITDQRQTTRAIYVDRNTGLIFVGISDGGPQNQACIWCYARDNDTTLRVVYQFVTGAFVERMRTRSGILSLLLNSPETGRAYIVQYSGYTTAPVEIARRRVAYPASDFDVRESDGALIVASPAYADRGKDPRAPDVGQVIDDEDAAWAPDRDLTSFRDRIWSWLRADDLAANYEDGDEVEVWEDRSGNGRHLYKPPASAGSPPIFRKLGLGARGAVSFDGIGQLLWSGINTNVFPQGGDTQATILPAFVDCGYALVMVVKPMPLTTKACILSQPFSSAGAASDQTDSHRVVANKGAAGTASEGMIYTRIPSQLGIRNDEASSFQNQNNVAIVTMIYGGPHSPQFCVHRHNGAPLRRYKATLLGAPVPNGVSANNEGYFWTSYGPAPNKTPDRTHLGRDSRTHAAYLVGNNSDTGYYYGDVLEIFVLRDSPKSPLGQYGVVEEPGYPTLPHSPGLQTEIEKIEGWIAHRYGVGYLLDDGAITGYPHPFRDVPPSRSNNLAYLADVLNTNPILARYTPQLDIAWILASTGPGSDFGGVGDACKWDGEGNVYSVGKRVNPVGLFNDQSRAWVRRIQDADDAYTLLWHASVSSGTIDPTFDHPRMAVDEWDNLWVPWHFETYPSDPLTFYGYNKNGTVLAALGIAPAWPFGHAIALPPPRPDFETNPIVSDRPLHLFVASRRESTGSLTFLAPPSDGETVTIDAIVYTFKAAIVAAYDVRIEATAELCARNLDAAIHRAGGIGTWYHGGTLRHPTVISTSYEGGVVVLRTLDATDKALASTSANITPSAATTTKASPTVHRVRLVGATPRVGATRIHAMLAVAGGSIRRRNGPAWDTITGGESALSASARYVESTDLFGERFYTDGETYLVYNPRDALVRPYTSRSAGEIPVRCQLITSWRGAILLARSDTDPQNWHLSRRRLPYDWNQALFPPTSEMSISGNNSRVGRCPDIINCLIPWNDDLLLMGGDKRVWRLTGDPMAPNSSLDDMNVDFGLAFGRPFCRDRTGRLWVLSNRGSLYVATPAGGFKSVSERAIERRLQDIDFSTHFVRMEWDWRSESIYIALCPFGATAGDVTYWAFDVKNGGFWPDNRYSSGHRIHSMLNFDGDDPDDRVLLFGCEDGYVRRWDEMSSDDDGAVIESRVLIGPLASILRRPPVAQQLMTERIGVLLDSEQDGCVAEGVVSSDAKRLDAPVVSAEIEPGAMDTFPFRARGNFHYIRLRNSAIGRRWAIERLWAEIQAADMVRTKR